jgi:flagellar hook-basal body complex protein FliE
MVEAINPIGEETRLAALLGADEAAGTQGVALADTGVAKTGFSGNLFEDMLTKAVDALEGVSQADMYANQMIDRYVRGDAQLHEVMLAQSKASILVQLAMTTINSAVATFKELTQMQV